jgi:PBSX family phage terminase large subunit
LEKIIFSPKQQAVIKFGFQSNKRIILAYGAIRSGKTISMYLSFLLWSLLRFENETFIVAGKTNKTIHNNLETPAIRRWIEQFGIKFVKDNDERSVISYMGHTNYYIKVGANDKGAEHRIAGATAAGCFCDECARYPQEVLDQIRARCSVEGAKQFLNCNPASALNHVKTEILDNPNIQDYLETYIFLMNDNPTMSDETREMYEAQYSGVFYKRLIEGLWCGSDEIIYNEFDPDRHLVADYPEYEDLEIVGIDTGTQDPTAAVLIKVDKENRVCYVTHEYYSKGQDKKGPDVLCDEVTAFVEHNADEPNSVTCFVDPSTTWLELFRARGLNTNKADNTLVNRVSRDGRQLMGINLIKTLLANDILKVHYSCNHLIDEFMSWEWEEGKIDVPMKGNDHVLDCLRYALHSFAGTLLTWIQDIKQEEEEEDEDEAEQSL